MQLAPPLIHPSALVEPGAKLASGVKVGPFCRIGATVSIGPGTVLHSHIVIEGNTEIGEGNEIFPFAVLGSEPQDLKYGGQATRLVIGSHNKIRESVTINTGTVEGGGITRVGDHCAFLVNTHIGHDAIVGSYVTMSPAVLIGGHSEIADHVTLGGATAIAQRLSIGEGAFSNGASTILGHVPPFVAVSGSPATIRGLNLIGLRRRGFEADTIKVIKAAMSEIIGGGEGTLLSRVNGFAALHATHLPEVECLLKFLHDVKAPGLAKYAKDEEV